MEVPKVVGQDEEMQSDLVVVEFVARQLGAAISPDLRRMKFCSLTIGSSAVKRKSLV